MGKTERIKRNTIIGRIEEGGIGLVDIETKLKALKAAWVSRILNNNGLLCRYIQHVYTRNSVDINFLLKKTERNIKNFRMIEKFPIFYKEVIVHFNNAKKVKNIKKFKFNKVFITTNVEQYVLYIQR